MSGLKTFIQNIFKGKKQPVGKTIPAKRKTSGDDRPSDAEVKKVRNKNEAVKIDKASIDLVESFNETDFMDALEKGISQACGGGPIAAAMVASKKEGANNAKMLCYKNSGDVTGDHAAVVGYLSAAFSKLN